MDYLSWFTLRHICLCSHDPRTSKQTSKQFERSVVIVVDVTCGFQGQFLMPHTSSRMFEITVNTLLGLKQSRDTLKTHIIDLEGMT